MSGDAAASGQPYVVVDLLDEARYTWRGEWNYVRLDPAQQVAHVFVVEQRARARKEEPS